MAIIKKAHQQILITVDLISKEERALSVETILMTMKMMLTYLTRKMVTEDLLIALEAIGPPHKNRDEDCCLNRRSLLRLKIQMFIRNESKRCGTRDINLSIS